MITNTETVSVYGGGLNPKPLERTLNRVIIPALKRGLPHLHIPPFGVHAGSEYNMAISLVTYHESTMRTQQKLEIGDLRAQALWSDFYAERTAIEAGFPDSKAQLYLTVKLLGVQNFVVKTFLDNSTDYLTIARGLAYASTIQGFDAFEPLISKFPLWGDEELDILYSVVEEMDALNEITQKYGSELISNEVS